MATPDPKPRPRIVDHSAGYDKMRREQRCRLCGATFLQGWGLTRHHIVPRGQGGDDVDDNLVPLCGHGTALCHGAVESDVRARSRLRGRLRSRERRYARQRYAELGKPDGFDRRYPENLPPLIREA